MLAGKKIVLVKGGPGAEREVSLATGRGVAAALRELGADVTELDIMDTTFELPAGTELVFNAIHGTLGEDGDLQRELEKRRVPYTGAGSVASDLAFDKIRSKAAFMAKKVPTAAYQVLDLPAQAAEVKLPIPVCVKPPRQGSSVGVHLVKKAEDLQAALDDCAKYDKDVLIETLVIGRELTVGILGDEALPVVEIRPRQGFYDMKNKYPWMNPNAPASTGSDYQCPAELSPEITAKVQAAALAAHRSLGTEVYSRVDVLVDGEGDVFVLEVNTIPGMTPSSLLPMAAKAVGVSYAQLCERIAVLSLAEKRNAT
jgi:D-alanine-D-alanine ligase